MRELVRTHDAPIGPIDRCPHRADSVPRKNRQEKMME
jgi:hypothetical protein